MRQWSILFISLLVSLVFIANSGFCIVTETYNTKYVDGYAPITIDGDLSDWEFVNVKSVPITLIHLYTRMDKYNGPSDVSGVFRSFADRNYLYMAFEVKDDILIIGE